jgi:hypothetical protein
VKARSTVSRQGRGWLLTVVLPKDPLTGRRREISATYTKKKEAEAARDRVLNSAGRAPDLARTVTVSQALSQR